MQTWTKKPTAESKEEGAARVDRAFSRQMKASSGFVPAIYSNMSMTCWMSYW